MSMRSLSIAATGMQAQDFNVEVISNNLANITTSGYKRARAEFQDLLYQTEVRPGSTSTDGGATVPTGIQLGLGVGKGATYRIHGQGELVETKNRFDLAVNGKGFFQIQLPDGTFAYTRAGQFSLNENGEVVTAQGYTVSPSITVPSTAKDVMINASGEVLITLDGQVAQQNIGQFDIVDFINPAGLLATGNNLYIETTASGTPTTGTAGQDSFGVFMQGYLENSNVDPISELTTLIAAQRSYELNSKVISASEEMLQIANNSKK